MGRRLLPVCPEPQRELSGQICGTEKNTLRFCVLLLTSIAGLCTIRLVTELLRKQEIVTIFADTYHFNDRSYQQLCGRRSGQVKN